MNAPVYVDIDQGIHKVKLKVALNEKRKKLRGFSFSINIANFEAFCWTKKLISHLFFLKSEVCSSVYELKVVFGLLNEAIIHLVPLSLGWCTCHVNCVTVAPGRVT